jgi:uncharacterized protein YecT (DUF1311 family)
LKTVHRIIIPLAVAAALAAQERRITPITVERRQALIIGNSEYRRAPLQNPENDARAMDATLRKLGFEVRTLRNLDMRRMEAAIDDFTSSLAAGSLAFFYFSGHGIQVDSSNYLLPVDFAATSEADVRWTAYPATRLQEKLESSGARLRVLVLDACRDNPFRFKRDVRGGLVSMPTDAEGTLIAFATGDNNTADDNQSEGNGLYTKYLIQALVTPGLQLREAFQKAKEDVYQASHKKQNPSIYENIVGTYYLVSRLAGLASAPSGPPADVETWMAVKDSGNVPLLEQFLNEFPLSQYALAARAKLAVLRKPANTTPPAPAEQIAAQAKPSFDCGRAVKPTERFVCSNYHLAELDVAMVNAYRDALARSSEAERLEIRRDHLIWFKAYARTCDGQANDAGAMYRCIETHLSQHRDELLSKRRSAR